MRKRILQDSFSRSVYRTVLAVQRVVLALINEIFREVQLCLIHTDAIAGGHCATLPRNNTSNVQKYCSQPGTSSIPFLQRSPVGTNRVALAGGVRLLRGCTLRVHERTGKSPSYDQYKTHTYTHTHELWERRV